MAIQTPYIELSSLNLDNHIINGDMKIWQRFGQDLFSEGNLNYQQYVADRFSVDGSGSTGKSVNIIRDGSDVPLSPNYVFPQSYSFACNTGIAFGDVADIILPLIYRVEGTDYTKLAGQTVTLSFWVKSTVAGVFPASVTSTDSQRCYVTTFTINNTNVWQHVALTLKLEATNFSHYSFEPNSFGIQICIGGSGGTDFQTTTLNQWQNGNFYCTPTTQSPMQFDNQVLKFAGIQLNLGPSAAPFTLANRTFAAEYAACQRYFESSFPFDIRPQAPFGGSYLALNTNFVSQFNLSISDRVSYRVQKMRGAGLTFYSQTNANSGWLFYAASTSQYSTPVPYLDNMNGFNIQFTSGNFLGCSGNWTAESEL